MAKASFHWDDPLLLNQQLTDDERAVRDAAKAYAQGRLLPRVTDHDPATSIVTTLAQEKEFNSFMRLSSPGLIAQLRESFPDLPEQPDTKTVFTTESCAHINARISSSTAITPPAKSA